MPSASPCTQAVLGDYECEQVQPSLAEFYMETGDNQLGVACFFGCVLILTDHSLLHSPIWMAVLTLHGTGTGLHAASTHQHSHLELVAPLVQKHGGHPKEGQSGTARLEGKGARQGCDHDGPGLRLPPGVHNWAALLAHHLQFKLAEKLAVV